VCELLLSALIAVTVKNRGMLQQRCMAVGE
jgi:hypothetical protein